MKKKLNSEEITAILDRTLPFVSTPGQYVGNELHSVVKDPDSVELQFAFAFPDTYALGMSHLGMQILYAILNAREDCLAERVFAPWVDMIEQMRGNDLPLFSLETRRPVSEFDVIGFSLQYEMSYTNVLTMLDLGGVPLKSCDRAESDPLVIAGGPGAYAPEPIADFIDLFVLGDGEEKIDELVDALIRLKRKGVLNRTERLRALVSEVSCLYAPSLYDVTYKEDSTIAAIEPRYEDVPSRVSRHWVRDLDAVEYPENPIVPFVQIIHDRITLEIMRGCAHGCRFCQAGTTKRPVRHRSVERLVDIAKKSYESTGYSEISLASLSTSDYPHLSELAKELTDYFAPLKVGLSMPSLRVGEKLLELPGIINAVRKSGLTFAPEAATERLRGVINKDISNEDLLEAARVAYRNGWRLVKLYFMIGLPTETEEDVLTITALAREVSELRCEEKGSAGKVNVAVSTFVPRPHTPFQWEAMAELDYIREKQELLLKNAGPRRINIRYHKAERSLLEGVFSRGDRRLGKVILRAWELGCCFDGWDEHFDFEVWRRAFDDCGVDIGFYVHRERELDEVLPWDHIDAGVSKEFLLRERKRSRDGKYTSNCFNGPCQTCGAVESDDKCPQLK